MRKPPEAAVAPYFKLTGWLCKPRTNIYGIIIRMSTASAAKHTGVFGGRIGLSRGGPESCPSDLEHMQRFVGPQIDVERVVRSHRRAFKLHECDLFIVSVRSHKRVEESASGSSVVLHALYLNIAHKGKGHRTVGRAYQKCDLGFIREFLIRGGDGFRLPTDLHRWRTEIVYGGVLNSSSADSDPVRRIVDNCPRGRCGLGGDLGLLDR